MNNKKCSRDTVVKIKQNVVKHKNDYGYDFTPALAKSPNQDELEREAKKLEKIAEQ